RVEGADVAARVAGADDDHGVGATLHQRELRLRPSLTELGKPRIASSVVVEVRTPLLPHELRRGRVGHVERVHQTRAPPRGEEDVRLASRRIQVRACDSIEEIVLRLRCGTQPGRRVGELEHRTVRIEALQLGEEFLRYKSPELSAGRYSADASRL